MSKLDLHDEFIKALQHKIPKKNLVTEVADTLLIEKDSAYRRLAGKVNFSIREMGVISNKFGMSIDQLMRSEDGTMWLPFMLKHPLKVHSMDDLLSVIDDNIQQIGSITEGAEEAETGNVYNTLPMEYYLYSPVMTKYMFFRWGHYFIGTEEYNNYSSWEPPQKVNELLDKLSSVYKFDKSYYICDQSLIWTLCNEIANFYRMHVITTHEKNEIKDAFKDMLNKLEQTLNGKYTPTIGATREGGFYISPIHLGFTSNYFLSGDKHSITFQTNFSFCAINNNPESFNRLKNWVDSFRNISTLVSRSGRTERRLFFEAQHDVVDLILGRD